MRRRPWLVRSRLSTGQPRPPPGLPTLQPSRVAPVCRTDSEAKPIRCGSEVRAQSFPPADLSLMRAHGVVRRDDQEGREEDGRQALAVSASTVGERAGIIWGQPRNRGAVAAGGEGRDRALTDRCMQSKTQLVSGQAFGAGALAGWELTECRKGHLQQNLEAPKGHLRKTSPVSHPTARERKDGGFSGCRTVPTRSPFCRACSTPSLSVLPVAQGTGMDGVQRCGGGV
jgi:hypothetical protein